MYGYDDSKRTVMTYIDQCLVSATVAHNQVLSNATRIRNTDMFNLTTTIFYVRNVEIKC